MAHTVVNLNISLDPARVEALRLADEYVAQWTDQVKNERGYVHDKWNPTDPQARAEAVLKVAEWLMVKPVLLKPPPPPSTLFGWHPGLGAPSAAQYRLAKMKARELEETNSYVLVAEQELLTRMIEMYEEAHGAEESPS